MPLMILGLLAIGALALWGLLRWIAATPRLMTDAKACRGEWAEARIRQCEKGIAFTGIPVEPLNTYSNLAYLGSGWALHGVLGGLPSLIFAAAMTLLFLGSSMYHGTKTMWGFRLDHAGMYAVFGSLALYGIAPDHPATPWMMLGGALVLAVGFAFVSPGDLNARTGLLLALMSVRGFLLGTPRLAGLSLGIFLFAFGAWNVDKKTRILSRYGHAIWHVCTGAAIPIMFAALTR